MTRRSLLAALAGIPLLRKLAPEYEILGGKTGPATSLPVFNSWLTSVAGKEAKIHNPTGYQNVRSLVDIYAEHTDRDDLRKHFARVYQFPRSTFHVKLHPHSHGGLCVYF